MSSAILLKKYALHCLQPKCCLMLSELAEMLLTDSNTSAVRCEKVPVVGNASASSSARHVDAHVTYTCSPGLRFSSGLAFHTIVCLGSGRWSDTPAPCRGSTPCLSAVSANRCVLRAVLYFTTYFRHCMPQAIFFSSSKRF